MKEITEDKGRIRPVVEGDFQCDENGNSTRFYEVLSIVGAVDGSTKFSYISKKNVPIGVPITNEEYWYPFQAMAVPKGGIGETITDGEMDEVLGGDVAVYLIDSNNNAVLDEEGKPIEII